jgi:hypothetical protein
MLSVDGKMINDKLLKKWFDEYEIKARLISIVILCLPMIFLGVAAPKEWIVKVSLLIGESIFFITFCKILMGIVQTAGNIYQDKILQEWDGLPSTRFLRKNDSKFSINFKEKFVQKVKSILSIELDIEDDSSINTAFSAIKTYLHKYDKEKKWQKFNIEYGFHRNLSGLKVWLILLHIFVLSLYIILVSYGIAIFSASSIIVWLLIFIIYILISFFSPRSCKINAEHYAESAIMTFYEMPVN